MIPASEGWGARAKVIRMMKLQLDMLHASGGTQARTAIDEGAVAECATVLNDCVLLPPVVAFFDGAEYWLADCHHRYHAHRTAYRATSDARVSTGSRRDAVLFAAGANADHGQRSTNADKRRAVQMLLDDEEWAAKSDSAIAKHAGDDTVALLEETQWDLERAHADIEAMKADDKSAEIVKWKRVAVIAVARQQDLQKAVTDREAELRRVTGWLRRIGRAVGEDDFGKPPDAVEAMARRTTAEAAA